MPPCWGLVCLTSLSRCLSRSSALGLPLGLGVRVCLCLTPGLTHVCISLSPHRRMSSASLLAPSLALSSCPQICLSGWGWGSWFAHLCFRRSLSVSPTPGSLLLIGVGVEDSALSPPLHPCLRLISLQARPPPSVSLMSQASRICLRLSLLSSPTSHPLHISRTLYPSSDWLPAPGGPGCPFSWGEGRRRGGPLTWPRPCRPPPHQPGFIKQTGPYIARPRGPGSEAALYGAAAPHGSGAGAGGRGGAALGSVSRPRTRPPPAPSSSPENPPDPSSQSQLLPSCLWNSRSEPQCSLLLNGTGIIPLQRSWERFSGLETSNLQP